MSDHVVLKDYLGDGAYVEFKDNELILTAKNGEYVASRIVLGPYEYEALKRFINRTPWNAHDRVLKPPQQEKN